MGCGLSTTVGKAGVKAQTGSRPSRPQLALRNAADGNSTAAAPIDTPQPRGAGQLTPPESSPPATAGHATPPATPHRDPIPPVAAPAAVPAGTATVSVIPGHRRTTVVDCAVSLRFLKRFVATHALEGVTTAQMRDLYVMPPTRALKCRYVDGPGLVAPEDVGRPTYFISHTWTGIFKDMIATLCHHLADEIEEEVFVWVDMFAVNQHDFAEDLGNLKEAIQTSEGGTLVVLGEEGAPLGRVWCLYEFANTVLLKGSDSLQMLSNTGVAKLGKMVLALDIEKAEYTMLEDRTRILGDIQADFGDYLSFNVLLKMLLLLDPLDYSVDLGSLLEQCGGVSADASASIWDLGRFSAWLRQLTDRSPDSAPAEEDSQTSEGPPLGAVERPAAVVVCGGAGEGKSTLAALLVAASGALQRYRPASKAAPHEILPSTPEPANVPIHAWHFFKHNDTRRQDAVRVIKTLAYQLGTCPQLPELRAVYMQRIQAGAIQPQQLVDADACFEALLRGPLEEYAELPGSRTPIVMLFDALDEADDRPLGSGFTVNPMMRLLSQQCATLPGVAFIMTSRSDVEQRHILSSLRANFSLTEMQAASLHRPVQLRQHVAQRLQAARPDARAGRWRPSNVSEAAEVAGRMVQLSECETTDASGDTAHNMVYLIVCMELLLQGRVLPLRLPATLHAAYSLAFTPPGGGGGGPESDAPLSPRHPQQRSVGELLAVLIAAREPLSPAQLRTLGLDQLRPLLPLLGALFYERDMRMHLLHKSLYEFLADPAAHGTSGMRVDVRAGHLCLAGAGHTHQQRLQQTASLIQQGSLPETGQDAAQPSLGNPYNLRHVVAHACLASDGPVLAGVLLNVGRWEATYAAGFGPAVLGDLGQLADRAPPASTALVADVLRWLRSCSAFLVKHPRAALQLACDAPHNSRIAQYAAGLPLQPLARLLNKEEDWSACLITLPQPGDKLVASVAISADGKTVVSGSYDETVRLWDLASGQCNATLKGHTDAVTDVVTSSDGTIIVSSSGDHTLRVWDVASSQCATVLRGHASAVHCVAIGSDDLTIASGSSDMTVRIWHRTSGKCTQTFSGHTSTVLSVKFTLDDHFIVSSSHDRTIRVWNVSSAACTCVLEGHTLKVTGVVLTPNGATLVSSSWDQTLRVWDAASGKCQRILEGHDSHVQCIAISLDGATLVSGSWDQTIRVWDMATGECSRTLTGHTKRVESVAISPDGTTIVSSSDDKTIRVWDMRAGQSVKQLPGHTGEVAAVSFSPDGRTMVSCSHDYTLRVWDLASGTCKITLEGDSDWVNGVAFCSDNVTVVSVAGNSIRLWDLTSGKCTQTFAGHTEKVMSVAVYPNGKSIVSGSLDRSIRLWDLASGESTHTFAGHTKAITTLAISQDNHTLVSGSFDYSVRVWDLDSGQCRHIFEGVRNFVYSVATSPDGHTIASGSDDKVVRVWDLRDVTRQAEAAVAAAVEAAAVRADAHASAAACAANAADSVVPTAPVDASVVAAAAGGGVTQAMAGSDAADDEDEDEGANGEDEDTEEEEDEEDEEWQEEEEEEEEDDRASGQCSRLLRGHAARVWSVAFSGDGRTLVSGSHDDRRLDISDGRTVRLWDLQSDQPISVVTADQGAAPGQALPSSAEWRTRGQHVFACFDGGNEVAVVVQQGVSFRQVASVYVLPPYAASGKLGMLLSSDARSLVVLDEATHKLLFYALA